MTARLFSFLLFSFFIVTTAFAADEPKPTAPPEPADMKPLFNGKDLSGWDGDMKLWSFKDGAVRGETAEGNMPDVNTFLIWTGGEVGDFELRCSFKIHSGNSGIQYRSIHQKDKADPKKRGSEWIVTGYQAEIANLAGKDGFLYNEGTPRPNNIRLVKDPKNKNDNLLRYLCEVGEKTEADENGLTHLIEQFGTKESLGKTYKKGDWNDYIIIAKGNNLKHYLNGYLVIDFTDKDPKAMATKGVIGLQLHRSKDPMLVEYKDMRLKQQ